MLLVVGIGREVVNRISIYLERCMRCKRAWIWEGSRCCPECGNYGKFAVPVDHYHGEDQGLLLVCGEKS